MIQQVKTTNDLQAGVETFYRYIEKTIPKVLLMRYANGETLEDIEAPNQGLEGIPAHLVCGWYLTWELSEDRHARAIDISTSNGGPAVRGWAETLGELDKETEGSMSNPFGIDEDGEAENSKDNKRLDPLSGF